MSRPEAEAEAAARLLERLLTEPDLRRQFRLDPVGSCRAAGLDNVAIEMEVATGKAAHTVDLRESKSSLAGVLIAAAVEGVAVWQLLETAEAAGGAAAALATHVKLPAIHRPDLSGVSLPDVTLGHLGLPGNDAGGGSAGIPAAPAAEPDTAAPAPVDAAAEPSAPASSSEPAGAASADAAPPAEAQAAPGVAAAPAAAAPSAAGSSDSSGSAVAAPAEGGAGDADPIAVRSQSGGDSAPDTLSMAVAKRSSAEPGAADPDHSLSFPSLDHPDAGVGAAAEEVATRLADTGPLAYPGDDATPEQYAAWMAAGARERGLPGELPVMAALVESNLTNVQGGDRDSVGFFQMRVGIWNEGAYAGYPKDPGLQLKWFLDQAVAQRASRVAQGRSVSDASHFGEWIADVERPAAQYRGRYQFQLDRAQQLLRAADRAPAAPAQAAGAAEPQAVRASVVDSHAASSAPTSAVDAGRAALDNPKLHFDAAGIADLKAGRIDPRLLAVLTRLSDHHDLRISCMRSDHSKFTSGGSISNHWHGRGIDIAAVDGRPVNASNHAAREVAERLATLDSRIRPSEIGTPWNLAGPAYFTDGAHKDHLHVGFDDPLPDGWRAPADLAPPAAASAAEPQAVRAGDIGAPAEADPQTLSLGVPEEHAQRAGAGDDAADQSLRFPAIERPGEVPATPQGDPRAVRAQVQQEPGSASAQGAEALADAAPGGAGPQALAAVAEAKKYLGTPYHWGGATPKTGFDCSGLMQWAYAKQGIATTRTTYTQIAASNATKVGLHALRPGDLVFFAAPGGDVHHVGMSLGGDRFIHAPHTGDVVKISKLSEPYYRQQFAGGRRFDNSAPAAVQPAVAPTPDPADLQVAERQQVADAAAVRNPDSLVFQALSRQEASHHASTLQFMAVQQEREGAQRLAEHARDAGIDLGDAAVGPGDYPGDGAGREALARWLGEQARRRGLPPELPVMASLVESGVRNLAGGDRDSVGFFQMRVGIWNTGTYEGYPDRPELQARWFIDKALEVKRARLADGDRSFLDDPHQWGNWIADVERPAEQCRGRYQERLDEARRLLS